MTLNQSEGHSMTQAQDIKALVERLESAGGPSDLFDAEIYATIGGAPHTTKAGDRTIPLVERGDPATWPAYTGSIDAAVALVEEKLPALPSADHRKSEIRLQIGDLGASAFISRDTFGSDHLYFGGAKTTPIAILLALFKALYPEGEASTSHLD